MFRFLLVAVLAALPLLARAQTQQQALVDRATLTAQDMFGLPNLNDPGAALRRARAVMICPQVFRVSFIFGVSGGECALLARDGAGSWSAPAFYDLGGGSFGAQAGIQDAEVVMLIMTGRALAAVMDNQFKIGGDASITVATAGAGIEGDTTGAFRADIVAYSQSRGLFVGLALNGGLLSSDTRWNHAYYGRDLAARQIVIDMQVNNPGADPLRAMLTRFGAPGPTMARSYAPPAYVRSAPAYQPPVAPLAAPIGAPQPLMPVQQEPLPPPARH